jgi:FAD/FMN-containing dehydrogenase
MVAGTGAITLGALEGIVGEGGAREARPEDAIDGVEPRFVAAPRSVEEASELMALAAQHGLAVAPRGPAPPSRRCRRRWAARARR